MHRFMLILRKGVFDLYLEKNTRDTFIQWSYKEYVSWFKHKTWSCSHNFPVVHEFHAWTTNSSNQNTVYTVHSKCINDQTLRSDIFLPKCPTNVWQIWESTLSKSDYLVGHFGRTWEWILKDFFLHFSRWICQTFCDRCVFVSVLFSGV
jgi:hypothetical protein